MSNTTCLTDIPFSIEGNNVFPDNEARLQLNLNSSEDVAKIIRSEWYVDDLLVLDQINISLSIKISCGTHDISCRILTDEGWSGIRRQQVVTCAVPLSVTIDGPSSVEEGETYQYKVIGHYVNGITYDLTPLYVLSGTGVTFDGGTMIIPGNPVANDDRQITIKASTQGQQEITKIISIEDTSPLTIEIKRADTSTSMNLNEGMSYPFQLFATYSDGTVREQTSKSTFTFSLPERGNFEGNVLHLLTNSNLEDSIAATVSATFSGLNTSLDVNIIDKSQIVVIENFDYMVVRYHWEEGSGYDLDILVGFEANESSIDGQYVGYAGGHESVPDGTLNSDAYLWWAVDNTASFGYEAVLIGMKKFIADFTTTGNIVQVGLYAVWFNNPISGAFQVELVTYKNGSMSREGDNIINHDGIQVSSNVFQLQNSKRGAAGNPAQYYKVGTLKYDKTTQNTSIEINQ
jgi:hypothetical protein